MGRVRSVWPAICEDERLAELADVHGEAVAARCERTWVRLWTQCDDEGRVVDNPKLIKAWLYPLNDAMTAAEVDADLALLDAEGFIVRYEAEGRGYIAVRRWAAYQHPQKPRASDIPAPPETTEDATATRQVREGDGNGTRLDLEVEVGSGSNPVVVVTDDRAEPGAAAAPKDGPVDRVFAAWVESTGKQRAVLDAKRRRLIVRALKDFPEVDVLDAVRGWRHSPHHRGENDRHTVYNDLGLLLRDAAHVEQFRDLERGGAGPSPPVRVTAAQAWERVCTALQRGQRPTFDDRTEAAIKALGGWQQLRVSTNQIADRAHFLQFWKGQ